MREETEILNLLDSQISDKEFLEEVRRSRFLRECKERGFPNLRKSGLIAERKEKVTRRYTNMVGDHKVQCEKKVLAINELRYGGMMAKDACKKIGVAYQTYADWAYRLGMQLPKNYYKANQKKK
jgi:hypothetical protein